jgi:proton-translocating NADH-quinone oxidoreductase chain L
MGAITAGFFGRFIGGYGAGIITTGGLMTSFFLSCIAFKEVGFGGTNCYFQALTWMDSELFYASWGFMFDSLTVTMLIVVTGVSSLVHLYSTGYMAEDPHLPRFMSYRSLFIFFMLILVTADNMVQMFVGWEGVGLCSYLLINFWFTRLQANKAAIKAMLVNRVGDFGLALGVMAVYLQFGSVDYATVFALAPTALGDSFLRLGVPVPALTTICILLFVGAVGKSAQLGLHTWLPDAMEGPTPVSALIHAATMVTAGVFRVARCSPLFEYAPTALLVVTVMGAMTAFMAATTGLLQNDLKRVIAYSTCSQLGYMIFACGVSAYNVGVFHLANHAFFKALLFLSAGAVIHAVSDEQDMRRMGGLVRALPFTYAMMFIGSFSLMGFPFLTGFYSKDVILEMSWSSYSAAGHFAHALGTLAAFFTAFYSMRLLYRTFRAEPAGYRQVIAGAHESPLNMTIPLGILSVGSIFIGYVSRDWSVGMGTDFWQTALFVLPENQGMVEAEFIPASIKLVPVIFSLSGAISAYLLYRFAPTTLWSFKQTVFGRSLYRFLNRKWRFDKVYNEWIAQPVLSMGHHVTFAGLDRGLIENFGPYGIARSVQARSKKVVAVQSGFVFHYVFSMVLGATLFAVVVAVSDSFVGVDLRVLALFIGLVGLNVRRYD